MSSSMSDEVNMKHKTFLILGLALAALLLVASAAFAQGNAPTTAPTLVPTPIGNTAPNNAPAVNPVGSNAGNNAVIDNRADTPALQSGQGAIGDEPVITEAVLPSAL